MLGTRLFGFSSRQISRSSILCRCRANNGLRPPNAPFPQDYAHMSTRWGRATRVLMAKSTFVIRADAGFVSRSRVGLLAILLLVGCTRRTSVSPQPIASAATDASPDEPSEAPGPLSRWAGQWRVDKCPLHAEGRPNLVGTILTIEPKHISYSGDKRDAEFTCNVDCTVSEAGASQVDVEYYLADAYHESAKAVGIDQLNVTVVSTNCDSAPFTEWLELDREQIVTFWDGAWYFLRRLRSRAAHEEASHDGN